ncbi:MAG TPA: metal ABC transporter permease [bacterium]|nr:metal ABC transporter permease [bacterium]HPP29774.1 metal ABC transporter permease [bacterium]
MELIHFVFFQKALIAALLAGIACGIAGVWIVTMRISFIGVAISHSAFAGALLGLVLGKPVIPFAFLFSFLACAVLGPLSDKGQLHPDTSIGIIFSSTLGLAFLFMGILPEAKSQALNLLWGSILTTDSVDIILLLITTILITITTILFYKELQSVIFNREMAKASGIAATIFFYILLFLTGATISATLKAVGGLLVFALIVNPAASAYQITYSMKKMYILSSLFGILSGWGGLFLAARFNLPAGASIVIVSTVIFIFSVLFSPKRIRNEE